MKEIGIITWHNHHNCGGSLQSYALYTVLNGMQDVVAEIVNYDGTCKNNKIIKNLIKSTVTRIVQASAKNGCSKIYWPYLLFEQDYLHIGDHINSYSDLVQYSRKFSTVICGSDQIWAPNVFDPVYMIDFISGETVKKASYAASIGLNDIPEDKVLQYKELLKDFFAISVRETKGKNLLKHYCGIDAEVVLDPTFLLTDNDYRELQLEIKRLKGKKFIFCYFLNSNNEYKDAVLKYAKLKEIEIVGFSKKPHDYSWMKYYGNIGPREFLWLIDNCEAVFTDSYHGTIFSLIFHKRFFTFERFAQDDPICQNSRLEQLDLMYKISSRIISTNDNINDKMDIDYIEFEKCLQIQRKKSMLFLENVIND